MSKKRVKLFDLHEHIQAVVLKRRSEEDNHSIKIYLHAEHSEMFITISLELEYEDFELRERKFEEEATHSNLLKMFNKAIEGTPLEEELTIKNLV